MTTNPELNDRLNREADQFYARGGADLDISQVLDRAGEIRRGRRMRATMLMAACVLAVAVPTVLVATKGHHEKPVTPAHHKVDTTPLGLAGLASGDAPGTGYVLRDVWHADGTTVDLTESGGVRAVARLGSRLLVEADTGEGNLRATVVPEPPDFVGQQTSWPIEGGLATSDNGDLAGFVQPDGTPVVVQDDGQVAVELPSLTRGGPFDAGAIVGSDCRTAGADCAMWVESDGGPSRVWLSTLGASAVSPRADLISVSDVRSDGLVAAMTSATDDGSCSAVTKADGSDVWSTCDHQLGSFSPDGEHLAAFPAHFDGAGASAMAVLDAATGKVVLELHTARDAFIPQMVWEDDTHLLAIVGEGTQAAILRIGLDGSREYAVPPTRSTPYEPPFVLPTR